MRVMSALKFSILIVEDVEEMREMLRSLLEGIPEVGRLSAAANLGEARLEFSRSRPDVILLDEVLPGESSIDWVEELAQEAEKVPVLLITGVLNRAEKLPKGAQGRLFKPEWHKFKEDRVRF